MNTTTVIITTAHGEITATIPAGDLANLAVTLADNSITWRLAN